MTGLKKTPKHEGEGFPPGRGGRVGGERHPFMCRKVKIFLILICVRYFPGTIFSVIFAMLLMDK